MNNTTTVTLQADPDIAGGFVVVAADGYILGFGDTKGEALAGARLSVAERCAARAFGRFTFAMESAIDQVCR